MKEFIHVDGGNVMVERYTQMSDTKLEDTLQGMLHITPDSAEERIIQDRINIIGNRYTRENLTRLLHRLTQG